MTTDTLTAAHAADHCGRCNHRYRLHLGADGPSPCNGDGDADTNCNCMGFVVPMYGRIHSCPLTQCPVVSFATRSDLCPLCVTQGVAVASAVTPGVSRQACKNTDCGVLVFVADDSDAAQRCPQCAAFGVSLSGPPPADRLKLDVAVDDAELHVLAAIAALFGQVPEAAHPRMCRYITARWGGAPVHQLYAGGIIPEGP